MVLSNILNTYKPNRERWGSGQRRDYKGVEAGKSTLSIIILFQDLTALDKGYILTLLLFPRV